MVSPFQSQPPGDSHISNGTSAACFQHIPCKKALSSNHLGTKMNESRISLVDTFDPSTAHGPGIDRDLVPARTMHARYLAQQKQHLPLGPP